MFPVFLSRKLLRVKKTLSVSNISRVHKKQACNVQLIDLLEKACIRFVHFSKENELRSRVFSEKMGLETGRNCHISLRKGGGASASAGLIFGPFLSIYNVVNLI